MFAKLYLHKALRSFPFYKPLFKTLRSLRLIPFYNYHGKINLTLAIKITVPKTIFKVLFEKEPLP
ncbi:hypothetical protein SAMN05443663_105143 [Flavobacterium defluvii]|uniref:Uncharacterized protein n=1 Tax=Flavobacterium defluvii TaxID=370979 RepID=A0A1M5PXP1_9FLAO|nr:hypothetical protein SAMN05443663_105143 [Flavobacterium defluvii]